MIKPSILARKILAQCPELNISEAQLTKDIEQVTKIYKSKPNLAGYSSYHSKIDEKIVADFPVCKFCGSNETWYAGFKREYEDYLAYKVCRNCGHWENF